MLNMIQMACLAVSGKIKGFLREEKGAVDIVAIVVMIGIATLLAVTFKTEIGNVLTGLFTAIGTNVQTVTGG